MHGPSYLVHLSPNKAANFSGMAKKQKSKMPGLEKRDMRSDLFFYLSFHDYGGRNNLILLLSISPFPKL